MSLFPHQSMHFARGNCGHLKAKWDNHPSCLSCNSCTRISPCSICSSWTAKVWNLAERRCLHATRKSVMMQRRKQKKSKKTKKSQSDMSDSGTVDGSTAPHSYTAWGRTHQGGNLGDLVRSGIKPTSHQSLVNRSSSHRSTSHQSTNHQSTGHQSTSHWATYHRSFIHQSSSHRSTGHQLSRHRSSSHRSTSHQSTRHQAPGSSQPGISFQSFAYDLQTQIPPGYISINVPIQSYAPSISSHVSHGSV